MRRGFEGLMVGRTLAGRYEVLDAVARGGMSVVFRGRDGTLGREVAVKVVSLAGASDTQLPNFRERFRREAASAARIQHPNVVQIFDYGTDPELELDFIVMELLQGRDLKETLRAGPLPRPEALRILTEAARGVAAGHRVGIVHRDVKPANVFLVGHTDRDVDAVKILDFGIAKPMEDDPEHQLTTIGSLPHSPAYASPEQLDPSQPLSPASDVYQLGLIAFEMLAGQRPYDEENRARVRGGQHVPLPVTDAWTSVPPHVCSVVERALRFRPEDRFPDAAAFVEALTTAREEDATAFHPVSAAAVVSAPVPDPDATELVSAMTGVPVIGPAAGRVHEAPPVDVVRDAPPAPMAPAAPRRTVLPKTPVIWAVPLLLLLAIAVWAARRGGGDDEAERVAATAPGDTIGRDSAAMARLDEEFVRLQGVVGAEAASNRPAPAPAGPQPAATSGTGPAAETTSPPVAPATPAGTAAASANPRAQAQATIEAAVHDLNKAWVEGDISRHVGHYASRVNYYNSSRLPRSGVRRDRTRDLRRYDDRRIAIRAIQVQWLADDRARVLVDKEWIFGGDGRTRQGRGMQEYVFQQDDDDGKWYVVSEQLLTTTEARSPVADN
ncbi:serine/threonine-protein kinase [Longimicrobium sp.]|uniref:serine/threonine-protein kinase n=1 Tax=Longimicrobium sp. TaxID=2029185 RepID=UPI002E342F6B|nr:serine/threonine-protein kinase [Longimicrobium sp.]HEX6039162.1 serine/threonine-protein kinase [Longimicrobium sp.]